MSLFFSVPWSNSGNSCCVWRDCFWNLKSQNQVYNTLGLQLILSMGFALFPPRGPLWLILSHRRGFHWVPELWSLCALSRLWREEAHSVFSKNRISLRVLRVDGVPLNWLPGNLQTVPLSLPLSLSLEREVLQPGNLSALGALKGVSPSCIMSIEAHLITLLHTLLPWDSSSWDSHFLENYMHERQLLRGLYQ